MPGLFTIGHNNINGLDAGQQGAVDIYTRVGDRNDWQYIASPGRDYFLAAIAGGELFTWGSNWAGQLGLGDEVDRFGGAPNKVGTADNWVQVAIGEGMTAAINSLGELYTTGTNWAGQLGHGDDVDRNELTQVGTDTDWSFVAAGLAHCLAIKTDGTLWGWGSNWAGSLGLDNTIDQDSPVQVGTDTDWVWVQAGNDYSVALKSDGTLYSAGRNSNGRTGQGTTSGNIEVFTQIGSSSGWQSGFTISPKSISTIVSNSDGHVYGWGRNEDSELGLEVGDISSPVVVKESTTPSLVYCEGGSGVIIVGDAFSASGTNLFNCHSLGTTVEEVEVFTDAVGLYRIEDIDAFAIALGPSQAPEHASFVIADEALFIEADFISDASTTDSASILGFTASVSLASEAGVLDETQSWISQILQSAFAVSAVSLDTAESLYHVNPFSAFTASDQLRITEVAKLLSAVDIGDELTADALQVLQLLSAAVLEDNTDTHLTTEQNLAASLTLLDVVSGAFDISVASAASVQAHFDAHLQTVTELLSAAATSDTVSGQHIAKVMFLSAAETDDTLGSQAKMQSDLESLLHTAVVLQIGDDVYEGWVLNIGQTARGDRSFAFSQYDNYPFTRIAEFGGRFYGVADDGLYLLEGDSDDGKAIAAAVKTGLLDLNARAIKDAKALYLGYTSDGQLVLKVTTTGGGKKREDWYRLMQKEADDMRTGRVTIQRGLRATYWQFELCNVDGADFDVDDATLLYEVLSRRIRK